MKVKPLPCPAGPSQAVPGLADAAPRQATPCLAMASLLKN
jgi:hypothetical protein